MGRGSLIGALGLACSVASCASERVQRHWNGTLWKDSLATQLVMSERLLTQAGLFLTTGVLLATDELGLVSDAALDHQAATGDTQPADGVRDGLQFGALGMGLATCISGDRGRALEVGAEIWITNSLLTGGFKELVGRKRPNGEDDRSFPSGHSSAAFAMATFVARSLDQEVDGMWGEVGYLLYAPAAFVAVERVRTHNHYPSDVAAGALLGYFVANTIFDAHFGPAGSTGRRAIFAANGRPAPIWNIAPWVESDLVGLSWNLSF